MLKLYTDKRAPCEWNFCSNFNFQIVFFSFLVVLVCLNCSPVRRATKTEHRKNFLFQQKPETAEKSFSQDNEVVRLCWFGFFHVDHFGAKAVVVRTKKLHKTLPVESEKCFSIFISIFLQHSLFLFSQIKETRNENNKKKESPRNNKTKNPVNNGFHTTMMR